MSQRILYIVINSYNFLEQYIFVPLEGPGPRPRGSFSCSFSCKVVRRIHQQVQTAAETAHDNRPTHPPAHPHRCVCAPEMTTATATRQRREHHAVTRAMMMMMMMVMYEAADRSRCHERISHETAVSDKIAVYLRLV